MTETGLDTISVRSYSLAFLQFFSSGGTKVGRGACNKLHGQVYKMNLSHA